MKIVCSFIFILSIAFTSLSQKMSFEQLLETDNADNAMIDSSLLSARNDTVLLKNLLVKSEKEKNYSLQCYLLNALGVYSRNSTNYNTAVGYHTKALNLAIIHKLTEHVIISKNNLGVAYRRTNQIIPALRYHQEALIEAEALEERTLTNIRSMAVAYNSMGNIYLTMDQYNDALTMFNNALKIEDSLNNKLGMAINNNNIGSLFEEKKEYQKALEYYKVSLSHHENINSSTGILICNNNIGGIYNKLNDTKNAEIYLANVIEKSEKLKDDYYKSLSYMNVGWLNILQEKEDGIGLLEQSVKLATNKHYLKILIDGHYILYEAYQKRNEANIALYHYKKYSESKEKLLNETNLNFVNSIQSKYDLEKKKNEYNELMNEYKLTKSKMNNNIILLIVLLLIVVSLLTITSLLNRQKDLKQEKQLLTLQHDVLNLQMNPHFLFNALNSIKLYIIRSDKEKAVFYLNKFASLFRTILSSVQQKEVNLNEEINNIINYVELENMRFNNSIDFGFQIDENIPVEKIIVPSLLLQVFVENAILHGLSAKEGKKVLKINVKKHQSDKIKIEIVDNGVGFKNTFKKDHNYFRKKSMGLTIVEARLKSYFNEDYTLVIKDYDNNNYSAPGTLVSIIIPVERKEKEKKRKRI